MDDALRRTKVRSGQLGAYRWVHATRPVPRRLRPYVRDYAGYEERAPGPILRRELPAAQVVVIFEFGPPITVHEPGEGRGPGPGMDPCDRRFKAGFVAGVTDRFALTEHAGYQAGLQLNLTPIGARRLFGRPMDELRNRVVDLDDLLDPPRRLLCERLATLTSWDARFDLLERLLDDQVHTDDPKTARIVETYAKIVASQGQIEIASLAADAGCSHRHLIASFRDQIGVTPKQLARIARFDALTARLRAHPDRRPAWAELAAEFGYSDQPHLTRDVKRLSGVTPSRLPGLLSTFGQG